MKLGIYGGSFDPVHLGHLLVAQAAWEELGLDRLFFVPAAQSPFKPDQQLAPDAERLKLLRLALAGKTWCEIDCQELRRGGVSYTIDTVQDYQRRFPAAQLFYLIGTDHVRQLPQWRRADELARLVEFVIIPRPQVPCSSGRQSAPLSQEQEADQSRLTSAATEQGGILPPPFRTRTLNGFPLGVSSSQIRARVKQGLPIDLLVPPAVAEAIRNNGLYL